MSDEIETAEEPVIKRARKVKEKSDLFPILLKRNYRPVGEFKVEDGGEVRDPDVDEEGQEERLKMKAGKVIHVPVDEAKRAVRAGIAERHDDFE